MPRAANSALACLPIPVELVERRIYLFPDHKVMLEADLAELYGVATSRLNEAVKRNHKRFPEDFMFQLTAEEAIGRGGRRTIPFAFTELGVAMLSSVLKSERAVQMNIVIMRAFVRLRQALASNRELAIKIGKMEATQEDHSSILSIVTKDIENLAKHVANEFRKMTEPPRSRKRRIGFYTGTK